ncbi:hypothetical protein J633_3677 [Acinetobacter sp. 216872]|nr:hypothetical protein J633_3677 [Acinetobacter sp. 216872]
MPQPIIAAHQVTQTIHINQNQFTILKNIDLLCTRQISQNPYPIRLLPS